MGGLIGRYYIQDLNGANNIDHYVSIATPHYGTYLSWLGIGEGAKQMRPGSDFLTKLNSGNPIRANIKYTSIWTKTDEIVIPSSNSVLLGSTVMPDIGFVGHLLILWAPKTYTQIREALDK
jgi:triacylglycerol lipase